MKDRDLLSACITREFIFESVNAFHKYRNTRRKPNKVYYEMLDNGCVHAIFREQYNGNPIFNMSICNKELEA